MHRLGVTVITAAGHAGRGSGWLAGPSTSGRIAATKARMSQDPLAQQQVFQVGYAEDEAKVRDAARAFVSESFAAAEAEVRDGGHLSPKANHVARLSATWATEACAEAVEWAYR